MSEERGSGKLVKLAAMWKPRNGGRAICSGPIEPAMQLAIPGLAGKSARVLILPARESDNARAPQYEAFLAFDDAEGSRKSSAGGFDDDEPHQRRERQAEPSRTPRHGTGKPSPDGGGFDDDDDDPFADE